MDLSPREGLNDLDALVIAVRHDVFMDELAGIANARRPGTIIAREGETLIP